MMTTQTIAAFFFLCMHKTKVDVVSFFLSFGTRKVYFFYSIRESRERAINNFKSERKSYDKIILYIV